MKVTSTLMAVAVLFGFGSAVPLDNTNKGTVVNSIAGPVNLQARNIGTIFNGGVTFNNSMTTDIKNCAFGVLPPAVPLGTCVDVCEHSNFGNCINNVCSDACTVLDVPVEWQQTGMNSIRFFGNTKCWVFQEIDGNGAFARVDAATGDIFAATTIYHTKSIQCYRSS